MSKCQTVTLCAFCALLLKLNDLSPTSELVGDGNDDEWEKMSGQRAVAVAAVVAAAAAAAVDRFYPPHIWIFLAPFLGATLTLVLLLLPLLQLVVSGAVATVAGGCAVFLNHITWYFDICTIYLYIYIILVNNVMFCLIAIDHKVYLL